MCGMVLPLSPGGHSLRWIIQGCGDFGKWFIFVYLYNRCNTFLFTIYNLYHTKALLVYILVLQALDVEKEEKVVEEDIKGEAEV